MLIDLYIYPGVGIDGCTHLRTASEAVAELIITAAQARGWRVTAFAVDEKISAYTAAA